MEQCTFVIHVASPVPKVEPKDPNDLIAPAVQGTLAVLKAAQTACVKRVVLTSSCCAIVGKNQESDFFQRNTSLF